MINTIYKPKGSRIWRWKFRQQPADGKIEDVSLGTSEKQVAEKRRAELLRERQFERDGLILPKSVRDAAQRNPKSARQVLDSRKDLSGELSGYRQRCGQYQDVTEHRAGAESTEHLQ